MPREPPNALSVLSLSLSKKCSADIMNRGLGKQGSLVRKCVVSSD